MNEKLKLFIVFFFPLLTGCSQPDTFTEKALADTFLAKSGEEVSFETILKRNEDRTILLDIWASWCKDCVVGMPIVRKLSKKYPEVSFVYISIDKNEKNWKKGMEKFSLTQGQHYRAQNGWESHLFENIDLDWIPRYMLIDKEQKIRLFKAIKASDINIVKQIRALENEK